MASQIDIEIEDLTVEQLANHLQEFRKLLKRKMEKQLNHNTYMYFFNHPNKEVRITLEEISSND